MKKSDVTKIYITTDGFFTNRSDIKKKRVVAVVEQRKSDGAIAIVKVYSKDGKEAKIGKTFIPGLVLQPAEHPALTEESIVGRKVHFGVKKQDKTYSPIYPSDLIPTDDKLSPIELQQVRREVHNDTNQHRKTYKTTRKKWYGHFK